MLHRSLIWLLGIACTFTFSNCAYRTSSTGVADGSSSVTVERKAKRFIPKAIATKERTPLGYRAIGKSMVVRTTAYSDQENEKGAYKNLTCIGTVLRYGKVYRTAAADWSRYPLGTKFKIKGQPYIYVVEDYGSALVGTGTLDLYKPTLRSMNEWGARHVEIQIVEWGDYDKSLQILSRRKKYPHCLKMYNGIRAKMDA